MPVRPTIAVLLGGVSPEREVSLESGRMVLQALLKLGYEAEAVVYEGAVEGVLGAVESHELVFNALHGGEGEDGTVQRALEAAGIGFTGSKSASCRLAMDKQAAKLRMRDLQLPTPDWIQLQHPSESVPIHWRSIPALEDFTRRYDQPWVVKPNSQGSTVGVSIVRAEKDLDRALALAWELDEQILVEEYIPGRELTVTVLGQRPLPVVEIKPQHEIYDYACKYTDGLSHYTVPAELDLGTTVRIQTAATRLYEDLGCRHYSRVDLRYHDRRGFFCLELNTLPGMTRHSLTPMAAEAAGIPYDGLVERIVELAWGGIGE